MKSFQVSDKVMVYLQKETLSLVIKGNLRQRKYAPFSIPGKTNYNAYLINLLAEIEISNTFNVANLTLYHPEVCIVENQIHKVSLEEKLLSATNQHLPCGSW